MAADKNTRRWNSEHCKNLFLFILVLIICMGFAKNVSAVDVPVPSLHIGIEKGGDPADVSVLLQIVFLLTILALAPAILIMMTSFTRLVVVFSFLRACPGYPADSLERNYCRAGVVFNLFHYDACLAKD